ncbi:MAG: hypothetical protein V4548_13140 [Bacteroidota bacterium]
MKNFLIIALLLLKSSAYCQLTKIDAQKIESIELKADTFIGYDNLKNFYFIKDDVFCKRQNGVTLEYKSLSLSHISKVDIQNPLKVVLFYEKFNTAIVLDNQLNEIGKFSFLENDDALIVLATGIAAQNKLWIYDSLSQKIGVFDMIKKTFKPVSTNVTGNLKHYESDFNTFRWIDDKFNLFECDLFGKISSLGIVASFDQIQILPNEKVLYLKNQKLFVQDLKNSTITVISNIENSVTNFSYREQILTIFTETGITNYKITLP